MDQPVKTVAIGADHGGYPMKEALSAFLSGKGYAVEDVGTYASDTSVDYPLFAYKVAAAVAAGRCQAGIMIDGAGIGSCMAANKIDGIRAAMCYDIKTVINSREHNNANVLTLGGTMIDIDLASQMVETWLTTACTAARHLRRANQIIQLEKTTSADITAAGLQALENSGVDVTQFSNDDLNQIAQQITEILRAQGITGGADGCACCGDSCCGHCAEKNSGTVRKFIDMGASRISYRSGGNQTVPRELSDYIDHTLLKPDADQAAVEQLCRDAIEHNFASVCRINPTYVKLAAKMLRDSQVRVCTVVGFPLGTHTPQIKALEARQAIREGAKEIDMVINIGALKSGDVDLLYRDIRSVVDACQDGGAICKVIIETALLSDDEKIIASQTARRARANFVKTSTGFASGGATAHDVALMAEAVKGSGMGVKASGGIRSRADAMEMIAAGATRIGASASVEIVTGGSGVTESY